MTYKCFVIFKETRVFTRQINKLLSDDDYKELQKELIFNPAAGSIIKKSGGLRKVRWSSARRGKRGGIRAIYYWYVNPNEIYMLLAYGKNEQETLSAKELNILRKLVEDELK